MDDESMTLEALQAEHERRAADYAAANVPAAPATPARQQTGLMPLEHLAAEAAAAARRVAAARPESPLADEAAARQLREQFEAEQERCRDWYDQFVESIPYRYRAARPTDESVQRWLNGLFADRHADSITILGPTGSGKTHEVYGALRLYAEECANRLDRPRVFCTTVADFLDIARGFDSHPNYRDTEHYLKAAMHADVLFFDDLGVASTSDRTETILYRVIDYRWREQLPMAVTSNLTRDEFREKIGDRLTSRLVGMGKPIALTAADHRRESRAG